MERLPQEIIIYHIMRYLDQKEIVNGLSEVNKYLCDLMRREYGVTVEAYPFEELWMPPQWRNIEGVKCRPTVWGKRGMKCEEFMAGVEKDENGCPTSKSLNKHLGNYVFNSCSFSQYDIQRLQTLPLKTLELGWIELESSDFQVIQSITTLEILSIESFSSSDCLDVFPPNVKTLRVFELKDIRNLPKSLISLDARKLYVSETNEPRLSLPPGLLHLRILNNPDFPSFLDLPFDLPLSLKTLMTDRNFPTQTLSQLNNLEHLELRTRSMMGSIPNLPQSLRKLALVWCIMIKTVVLPPYLEELLCEECSDLEIDLSLLPQQLKKVKIVNCSKISHEGNISFPLHIEELHLGDFRNITTLPDLPQCLRSLTLELCINIKPLPKIPGSLRKFELDRLEYLNSIPPLPETLESLSLLRCYKLKMVDRIPSTLKELKIDGILNFTLPSHPDTLIKLVATSSLQISSPHLTAFPPYLEYLELHHISGIDSLPPFPGTLKKLKLQNIPDLKFLPVLPESLKGFELRGCDKIRTFPKLPSRLETLVISKCEFLGIEGESSSEATDIVGKLPNSLKKIELINCKNLRAIGELPSSLKYLWLEEMNERLLSHSTLPRHLENITIRVYENSEDISNEDNDAGEGNDKDEDEDNDADEDEDNDTDEDEDNDVDEGEDNDTDEDGAEDSENEHSEI